MFPVRYELNSYINLLRNSVFEGLNKYLPAGPNEESTRVSG
jgi:hypothetical protein